MNYRSVFLATTILIGEKSSASCSIARHLDEKSRDCKQRIAADVICRLGIAHYCKWKGGNIIQLPEKYRLKQANFH
jgi:hypothetical protein